MTAATGWQLELTSQGKRVGTIPLATGPSPVAAPALVASLSPRDAASARLAIRWGGHQGSVDVEFPIVPAGRRSASPPNQTINRPHDAETPVQLAHALMVAQRNETAIVAATGSRVAIQFPRSTAPGEREDPARRIRGLRVEGRDFAQLARTAEGSVVLLTETAVPRLQVEAPVRFGNLLVTPGNHGAGFPGAYGLWLKRVANGWRLVFNGEPDVWGSQHDSKADVGEVALDYSAGHEATRPFAVGLTPDGPSRGQLAIMWGPHEWTVGFELP
jgi:hypothetical protein